jgi:hypothetical protein
MDLAKSAIGIQSQVSLGYIDLGMLNDWFTNFCSG